jgi:hypothetical protein
MEGLASGSAEGVASLIADGISYLADALADSDLGGFDIWIAAALSGSLAWQLTGSAAPFNGIAAANIVPAFAPLWLATSFIAGYVLLRGRLLPYLKSAPAKAAHFARAA